MYKVFVSYSKTLSFRILTLNKFSLNKLFNDTSPTYLNELTYERYKSKRKNMAHISVKRLKQLKQLNFTTKTQKLSIYALRSYKTTAPASALLTGRGGHSDQTPATGSYRSTDDMVNCALKKGVTRGCRPPIAYTQPSTAATAAPLLLILVG